MSRLCIDLPPLAPDYSGAASALFDLGGIVVMHDASGCTGNYTSYDEPRWLGSRSAVFCSGLRRMDAVMGNDDKYIRKTIAAAKDLSPTVIAYLGSPVPMVIGTDLKGMAAETEYSTGIPSFGFSTTGQRFYDRGASDVFTALIKRFAKERSREHTSRNRVNILGLLPIDFGSKGNCEMICEHIVSLGYEIVSRFAVGLTVEQVEDCSDADLSIVVSRSGLAAAKLLHKLYGIPYICGVPIKGADGFEKKLNREYVSVGCPYSDGGILIIHEQIFANSLRDMIHQSRDISVTIGSMFGLENELSLPYDKELPDESAVRSEVNSGRYSVIIADPMVKKLIKDENVRFIGLPHPAVSSKLHWDEVPDYLSDDIKNIISCL